jgi:uncharacterized membrane protein YgcG
MGVIDWMKRQRDTAEEAVDKQKRKLQAKSERRDIDYASRADMARGARESENYRRYNKGEISEELYKKRQERAEKEYETKRLAPEVRFTKGSEKVAKGAVSLLGAIGQDIESSATPRKGRGRSGGRSRPGSGGLGSIDFSSMGTGLSMGGGGRSSMSRPDFSNMGLELYPSKKRKR